MINLDDDDDDDDASMFLVMNDSVCFSTVKLLIETYNEFVTLDMFEVTKDGGFA